ncbi:MAG: hypothetical protein DELT_02783 [Desulfovibrio sp.]
MAITKQFLKTKPECKVTFKLSAEESGNAETAFLVGDFNEWDVAVTPMKKNAKGDFTVSINLPVGDSQKFRYFVNGDKWLNDPEADGYQLCAFTGAENFLVEI